MPPQQQRKASLGSYLLANGLVGAGLGGVVSLFYKKASRARQIGVGAILGGLLGISNYLSARKHEPMPQQAPAFEPPAAPPAQPERPDGLLLANVPQVLDFLVAKGEITHEQQAKLLADIQQGRKGFAAEMAIADGFITKEKVEQALTEQAAMKAQAAIIDIQSIGAHGTITVPQWLKANWGNNGVNPAAEHPTRSDGASAAANIAQNLVMLANTNPNPQLLPIIQQGIVAAGNLSRGIAQGDSATVPLAKMGGTWREAMNNALLLSVQATQTAPLDAQGKPVDIYSFISARNAEVTAAIEQTLKQPPQQGQANSR